MHLSESRAGTHIVCWPCKMNVTEWGRETEPVTSALSHHTAGHEQDLHSMERGKSLFLTIQSAVFQHRYFCPGGG